MEELDTLIVQAMGAAQKQGNILASFLEVISFNDEVDVNGIASYE